MNTERGHCDALDIWKHLKTKWREIYNDFIHDRVV